MCERASSHRAREVRDSHQRRRARTRRLRRTHRTISSVPRACQHPGQNSYTKVQGVQTHKASPRRDLCCEHEGREERKPQVLQTLNGCFICFNTIAKEYVKKVVHTRDKAETCAVQRHTYRRKVRVVENETERTLSFAKVFGKCTCWRNLYARFKKQFHKQSGNLFQTRSPWTSTRKETSKRTLRRAQHVVLVLQISQT